MLSMPTEGLTREHRLPRLYHSEAIPSIDGTMVWVTSAYVHVHHNTRNRNAALIDHAGHHRAPSTTNCLRTPKAQCCHCSAACQPSERPNGNERAVRPRLHHTCGFATPRHTRLRRNRPCPNAIVPSLMSVTWRCHSERQGNPIPPQRVIILGTNNKRDANGAIEAIRNYYKKVRPRNCCHVMKPYGGCLVALGARHQASDLGETKHTPQM